MKNFFYKTFLIVSISLFTFSCFETDDGDGDLPQTCNVDSYIDAYLSAIEAFNANTNYSTCATLKNRAIELLNAIRNCDYYEDAEYWEEAVAAWNSVNCSDLL